LLLGLSFPAGRETETERHLQVSGRQYAELIKDGFGNGVECTIISDPKEFNI
jgi:hypothetical protein